MGQCAVLDIGDIGKVEDIGVSGVCVYTTFAVSSVITHKYHQASCGSLAKKLLMLA